MRHVCIHGHFYQPPRENPWLETIELQEGAYPYHDWNERITAECYAPNADARILDASNRIQHIVNNYARMSFNFGPTLLSWLERHRPDVYGAILEADRASRETFGGHGSALAQAYNHAILPLANDRDRRTQVRWGVRDFVRRFGREPEGMWLPETAVDTASLVALADEGIRFTILAPAQAAAFDDAPDAPRDRNRDTALDTTVPYRVELPAGREIVVFFYDQAVSSAVAFDRLLSSGAEFTRRLLRRFPPADRRAHLVHIATDGETYGHHHRFGEMALAYALDRLASHQGVRLTNYGEYLELHPARERVRIVEPSSWSCAHGVNRWTDDCGCAVGGNPGFHQRWRRPLRAALDWLRDELAPPWERALGELLHDPWAARDDYIDVVLDRSPDSVAAFFGRHARSAVADGARERALELLELQRQALLMYTSCAWFFDEISGIETMQVLSYADRALELAAKLFGATPEEGFLARLAEAPSNLPECGDGRRLFLERVRPARVDPPRVAANVAASLLFDDAPAPGLTAAWAVDSRRVSRRRSTSALATGEIALESRITGKRDAFAFGVLHAGEDRFLGAVAPIEPGTHGTFDDLAERFERGDLAGIERRLVEIPARVPLSLATLLRDPRRRVVEGILESTSREAEELLERLWRQHVALLGSLHDLASRPPRVLSAAAALALYEKLRRELSAPEPDPGAWRALVAEASRAGVTLGNARLAELAAAAVERLFAGFAERPDDPARLTRLLEGVRFARELPFAVDLRRVETGIWRLRQGPGGGMPRVATPEWTEALRELADRLNLATG